MVYSSSWVYPSLYSGGHQLLALLIILHSRLSFPLFWGQVLYPLVYHYHFYILHYSLTHFTHFTQLPFIYLTYLPYSSSLYPQLYIFIFTLQHQPFLLLFILPLSPFHFPFIPYSLFSNYNIILYPFIPYSTLLYSSSLLYFIHYSLYTILHYYTQPYYH